MNTSRRWMNLMRFSLNVAVSLQTIRIRSERPPFSNGGHSTTRNRSKLAQKGSAKPFMRKADDDEFCSDFWRSNTSPLRTISKQKCRFQSRPSNSDDTHPAGDTSARDHDFTA